MKKRETTPKTFRKGVTEAQVKSALRTIAMNPTMQRQLERHLPTRAYLIRIARRLTA